MAFRHYSYKFRAMGSPCEFQLYAQSDRHAFDAIQSAFTEVNRLEKKYSRYRPDSVATHINQNAFFEPVEVDRETAQLLDYADAAFRQSCGAFDITSGVLRKAWNFKTGVIPHQDQIKPLLRKVGWEKVHWNGCSISFSEQDMEIDFGGYVKEYAVDAVATVFFQHELHHALVDLGGDMKVIGPHPDGSAWSIGIRNPHAPKEALATVRIYQGAIASSGDYERVLRLGGKKYSHILNPKTGWPIQGLAAVTIIANECLIAGSCTTLAMLQEPEQSGIQWLEELGLDYIAIEQCGTVHRGWKQNRKIQTVGVDGGLKPAICPGHTEKDQPLSLNV